MKDPADFGAIYEGKMSRHIWEGWTVEDLMLLLIGLKLAMIKALRR